MLLIPFLPALYHLSKNLTKAVSLSASSGLFRLCRCLPLGSRIPADKAGRRSGLGYGLSRLTVHLLQSSNRGGVVALDKSGIRPVDRGHRRTFPLRSLPSPRRPGRRRRRAIGNAKEILYTDGATRGRVNSLGLRVRPAGFFVFRLESKPHCRTPQGAAIARPPAKPPGALSYALWFYSCGISAAALSPWRKKALPPAPF